MTSDSDEVLVAILNNPADFEIVRDQRWYRIPVSSFDKWLKRRWPPQWLAFYQTKIFGREAYAINYYAQVLDYRIRYRHELLPDEMLNEKTNRRYYQIMLGPLRPRDPPIFSRRWRRIVFISTTWQKFSTALEINDLYDESPLEDRIWAALKRLQIAAERQFLVKVRNHFFFLDFAVFCNLGKLDIETDGDQWHFNPERASKDMDRDNALKTRGWRILRFNADHITKEMDHYCLPHIKEIIDSLGGVDEGRTIPRPINLDPSEPRQLSLFDD